MTDCIFLGVKAPVLISGNLDESTGGIAIKGPKGKVRLKKGLIVAQRHLHIEPLLAKKLSLKDGDKISIKIKGSRSITFHNVAVRSRLGLDKSGFQLDTDEGNAAGATNKIKGEIIS